MEEKEFILTDDVIKERLRINDSNTIDAVYSICCKLYDEENDRNKLIEEKSKSLINGVGVLLGLLFAVGGFALDKIDNVTIPYFGCPRRILAVLYLILGLILVSSGSLSFLSLFVRQKWKTFSEKDIFNANVIDKDKNYYIRYMTTHVWKIYRNNFLINNNKAAYLLFGQILFILSLASLGFMIIIMGLCIYAA